MILNEPCRMCASIATLTPIFRLKEELGGRADLIFRSVGMRNARPLVIVICVAGRNPQNRNMKTQDTLKQVAAGAGRAARQLTGWKKWLAAALALLATAASLCLYGCSEHGAESMQLLHDLYHSWTDAPCVLPVK